MKTRNKDKFNRMSPQGKGNPSDQGKSKAQIKDAPDRKQLEREEKMEKKYLNEDDEPAQNVKQENPNRNTDKPGIDKPTYGSAK